MQAKRMIDYIYIVYIFSYWNLEKVISIHHDRRVDDRIIFLNERVRDCVYFIDRADG